LSDNDGAMVKLNWEEFEDPDCNRAAKTDWLTEAPRRGGIAER